MRRVWFLAVVVCALLAGCASPAKKETLGTSQEKVETRQDVQRALESVTQAISGQHMTEEEMKNLSRRVREDEGTRKAVATVTEAVSGAPTRIKYCPVDGKRFSAGFKMCPEHNAELKLVE